jgi:leucyl aminopeptidase
MILMEYRPPRRKNAETIVLVGKGVTFDSGGLSIKPAQDMGSMKGDMSGGAAVIGAMGAIADLQLPHRVIGIVPAVENLPGGSAQRPGDIVRSHAGLTIEIINTDAEGRLILADALSWARRFKPAALVDIATLTGACAVALGNVVAGLMGTDRKVLDALRQAGETTGENVWELPLRREYVQQMEGTCSDLINSSEKRVGGALTAAGFLSRFAEGVPWAHLDIAGTAWTSYTGLPSIPKGGASGFGARLLAEFVRSWK